MTQTVARLSAAGIAVTELSLPSPAWTRCSSPSPGATPLTTTSGGRMNRKHQQPSPACCRWSPDPRAAVAAAAPQPGPRPARPDQHRPHAGGADRRHPAADHLPGDVHLHLRRGDRPRLDPRLPGVPAAGDPGPDHRDGRDRHRGQPQQRRHQGHLRPLPQPADRPLGSAGRRGAGRRGALRDPVRRHARVRLRARLPRPHRRAGGPGGLRAVDRLRPVPELGVGVRRHDRPHLRSGAGDHDADRAPAELRLQHVRPHPDDARAGCSPSSTSTRSPIWWRRCAACCWAAPSAPTCCGRWRGWASCWWCSSRWRCGPTAGGSKARAAVDRGGAGRRLDPAPAPAGRRR